jgi:hypothetical protein
MATGSQSSGWCACDDSPRSIAEASRSAEEDQEPHELVVDAPPGITDERLDDEDVATADVGQRARLTLAILEVTLLERAKLDTDLRRDPGADVAARPEREQHHAAA